ncbi:toll-like receptor 3 isoform X4 [Varanus komodoensis]|uniref:toll-like receptor 3 isoform X4 n=1 Tax=Varanus komodoensis TaxID=61221 RepID=UPI001CF79957|nr:toll-like receptor 3 isoform X4 [Varanus komodoensis]
MKMRELFIQRTCLLFILVVISVHCGRTTNVCKITNTMADCSHLKLSQIPSDLPANITALDISHNQLKTLPPENLTRYSQLAYLDAGFNSISKLQPQLCQSLPFLTVFKLEHNQLHAFRDQAFTYCTNLKELNLGFNILELTNEPFKDLVNLTFLDVSHNHLSSAKLGSLPQLENLQELVLSQNKITELKNKDFYFLGNSSLRRLDLSLNPLKEFLNLTKTGITSIKPRTFSWLRQLKTLDLCFNNIKQKLTGQEFQGLRNIETLYLSYNYQLNLTSESFTSVPSLRKLRLRRVGCKNLNISPSPFRKLNNLTILDISNNNIANMRDDLFDGLQQLEILDLQHNNLARLWKQGNPGGPVLFLKGLQSLHLLDLESNGFDEIPLNAFRGLSQLRSLNLRYNNLNLLPKFVFDDLTSLNALYLEKNLITAVEEKVFGKVFKNLKVLNMGYNPFDCTCESISWFVNWLNTSKTHILGLNTYICNTPSKYHKNTVAQFDTSPCDSAPFKLVFILSATSVLLLIFLILLIHHEGWRIQFIWSVAVSRVLGNREIDRVQKQYDYDAYIIHAKKDTNWVCKNFISLENNTQQVIRFCLEQRDFEAGISEIEAIVDSIKRSRKIIFVVTDHLLKDPWCKRFKVHHAIQQAIEQSRDSIILIFRHDIPDYKLNNALHLRRGMFRSRCILEWPVQQDRLNAFYQKLKLALRSSSRIL